MVIRGFGMRMQSSMVDIGVGTSVPAGGASESSVVALTPVAPTPAQPSPKIVLTLAPPVLKTAPVPVLMNPGAPVPFVMTPTPKVTAPPAAPKMVDALGPPPSLTLMPAPSDAPKTVVTAIAPPPVISPPQTPATAPAPTSSVGTRSEYPDGVNPLQRPAQTTATATAIAPAPVIVVPPAADPPSVAADTPSTASSDAPLVSQSQGLISAEASEPAASGGTGSSTLLYVALAAAGLLAVVGTTMYVRRRRRVRRNR